MSYNVLQKQGLSQESLPSARSTLSQQSSPSTGRPKLSAFPVPSTPMLGRGLQPGEEVELDFTSPPRRLDPAKVRFCEVWLVLKFEI